MKVLLDTSYLYQFMLYGRFADADYLILHRTGSAALRERRIDMGDAPEIPSPLFLRSA